MSAVHVLIEIDDTEYSVVHEIETDDPIVKTLQKIAKAEAIPLRTKSGRPYPWTVEGPDVRPGREGGWTDLTRTQTTERIREWYVEAEERDAEDHLFRMKFFIPGAVEAINEKQAAEKVAEIERRMALRAAEREEAAASERVTMAASLGTAEDFTMADAPPPPPPPPPVIDTPPPPPPPSDDVITQRVEKAPSAESRIRRSDGAASAARTVPDAPKPKPKPKKKPKKKPAPVPKKKPPTALIAGIAGVIGVGGLLAVVLSGGEPEPEPTPAPTPTAAPVTDLVVKKAPEPTPAPVVEATPPPMKLETFFSKGSISKYTAKQDAARLTSFAQTNVLLGYKAKHTAPGETHTVELEGRFRVEISDGSAGIFTGGSVVSIPGSVAVGSATSVSMRFDGKRLTVNVGGKRKSATIPEGTGFPRWRITVPGDATLTGFYAKGPPME
jgi:hypothetical protein